ncbi:MAG: DNA alkylation repair protein [Puniceicoccales bacterium]|jgi:3-methyladenine DNA glycosylase AlkD|nr:DNA alkylation repair protein [Puniceicoccales bacterium]
MREEICKQLWALADPNYQKFSQKLIPEGKNILGVRLPALRKIAKGIAKSDWKSYLQAAGDDSFEEITLQGLVIGYISIPLESRLTLIKNFVPKIDNWGICDTFCGTLKFNSEDKAILWDFLGPFFQDNRPFFLRFAIVMLFKFIDGERVDSIFSILSTVRQDHRHVTLAKAWLIAECCVHFPEKTIAFLGVQALDPSTQNVAIQKIMESFRIDALTKAKIRQLKQKCPRDGVP